MASLTKKILLITIFSIAMALLESSVVVYLRELYYPNGFTITFVPMPQRIILVELFREFATLIMLLSIAWLGGQTKQARFAWFIYSFAIWDIFYYIWLKAFINWPLSIFDWDILFLLPVTWLGPVLAPVICSITMIALAMLILIGESNQEKIRITKISWALLIIGSLVIYTSFTKDYTCMIINNGFYKDPAHILQNPEFLRIARTFVPLFFSWSWFIIGEAVILAGIFNIARQSRMMRSF